MGYFTIPMAKQTKETVSAVDIEPKMLEMLQENASKNHVDNIEYMGSDLNRIKLDEHSISKVMVSFVMHEVPNIDQTLSEVKRVLQPGGKLLVIEWEAVETASGPPVHIRISSENMVQILGMARFSYEIHFIESRQLCCIGKNCFIDNNFNIRGDD